MDETGAILRAPDMNAMRRDLFSSSVSDAQTRDTIKEAWDKHQLLLEPHGAVGWRGFLDYITVEPLDGAPVAVLETAHPAKFPEEIEKVLGFAPEVPETLAALDQLPEDFDRLGAAYHAFRDYLIANH